MWPHMKTAPLFLLSYSLPFCQNVSLPCPHLPAPVLLNNSSFSTARTEYSLAILNSDILKP